MREYDKADVIMRLCLMIVVVQIICTLPLYFVEKEEKSCGDYDVTVQVPDVYFDKR